MNKIKQQTKPVERLSSTNRMASDILHNFKFNNEAPTNYECMQKAQVSFTTASCIVTLNKLQLISGTVVKETWANIWNGLGSFKFKAVALISGSNRAYRAF